MFNDSQMPHPLTVQLCDKLGNHSDDSNVKVVLNHDRGLKVCKCTNRSFSCPLQSHLQSEFMCEIRDGGHIFPMGLRSFRSSAFSCQEQRVISHLRWITSLLNKFLVRSEITSYTWNEMTMEQSHRIPPCLML